MRNAMGVATVGICLMVFTEVGCGSDVTIYQPCESPDDCEGLQVNAGQWESFAADPVLCVVDPYGGGEPFCTTKCVNETASSVGVCLADPVCDPGCCYINVKSGKQGICVPYAPVATSALTSQPDDQDAGR